MIWVTNASVYTDTKKKFFSGWKILRQMSPTQSHHTLGNPPRQNRVFRREAGMLPWTIRHAAWVLTRYTVRRETRTTPYEKIRGQKYNKEVVPFGVQVLARPPGANVNQFLQPWVTGLWLGSDTLSQ